MQKPGCGENKVGLAIRARESFFALNIARMHWDDRRIELAWIVDGLRIPKRCIGIEEMIGAGRKRYPLVIRGDRGHMRTERTPSILNRSRHARLPFVKSLPGRLDGADDSFLKMSRILLHDNDRLLECVLFVDLLMELTNDGKIGDISVVDECDTPKGRIAQAHGSVLAVTCSGVFLKVLMSVASWATRRADSSRSFATLVASLPVSF